MQSLIHIRSKRGAQWQQAQGATTQPATQKPHHNPYKNVSEESSGDTLAQRYVAA